MLTAVPNYGYIFKKWAIVDSHNGQLTTFTTDLIGPIYFGYGKTVTAYFAEDERDGPGVDCDGIWTLYNDNWLCLPDNDDSGTRYFPHVTTRNGYETEIAFINTGDATAACTLTGYGENGNIIESMSYELQSKARKEFLVSKEFNSSHADIRYFVSTGSAALQGYMKFYKAGVCSVALAATASVNASNTLYIPHVASNNQFWTDITLINTTDNLKEVNINFSYADGNRKSVPLSLRPSSYRAFTVSGLFTNQLQPGIESAEISNAQGLIGLVLFGNARQMDGFLLPGDDQTTDATIPVPHVADATKWWTGIAAYNTSSSNCNMNLTPFNTNGNGLSPKTINKPEAKKRYKNTVHQIDLSDQTSWFKLEPTQPIAFFQLFGTLNSELMAAYGGGDDNTAPKQDGVFAKIDKSGGWTGIVLVNKGTEGATFSMTAYDDNGNVVATSGEKSIGGNGKIISTIEDLFSQSISSATYLTYTSNKDLVGFQLNQNGSGTTLDCLPALAPFSTD